MLAGEKPCSQNIHFQYNILLSFKDNEEKRICFYRCKIYLVSMVGIIVCSSILSEVKFTPSEHFGKKESPSRQFLLILRQEGSKKESGK